MPEISRPRKVNGRANSNHHAFRIFAMLSTLGCSKVPPGREGNPVSPFQGWTCLLSVSLGRCPRLTSCASLRRVLVRWTRIAAPKAPRCDSPGQRPGTKCPRTTSP